MLKPTVSIRAEINILIEKHCTNVSGYRGEPLYTQIEDHADAAAVLEDVAFSSLGADFAEALKSACDLMRPQFDLQVER